MQACTRRAHFYRQHHQEIVNNEHHVLWALAAFDGGGLACFATDNLVGNPLQTRAGQRVWWHTFADKTAASMPPVVEGAVRENLASSHAIISRYAATRWRWPPQRISVEAPCSGRCPGFAVPQRRRTSAAPGEPDGLRRGFSTMGQRQQGRLVLAMRALQERTGRPGPMGRASPVCLIRNQDRTQNLSRTWRSRPYSETTARMMIPKMMRLCASESPLLTMIVDKRVRVSAPSSVRV